MRLKPLITAFLFFIFTLVSVAQNQSDADAIRKQMTKIRQTTNWEDPVAAKKANEQIRELAKKMMMGGSSQASGSNQQQQQGSSDKSNDAQKINEMNEEMVDQKMDMLSQIFKSAAGGKGADILLAEPLREEIKREYKEDETPASANEQLLKEITFLILDMSSKTVQLVIDQMGNYKSINTLVITGGKNGSPVDLNDLLRRAENYPLEILYIINFRQFVNFIPKRIEKFNQLKELALFNNNFEFLPTEIRTLSSLKKLYVDMNPISSISQIVTSMTSLDTLGVAKTNISEAEMEKINQLLPKCKILRK